MMALALHIVSILIAVAAVLLVIDGLATRRRVLARVAKRQGSADKQQVTEQVIAKLYTQFEEHEFSRVPKENLKPRIDLKQLEALAGGGTQVELIPTNQEFQPLVGAPVFSESPSGSPASGYIDAVGPLGQHASLLESWFKEKQGWPDGPRFVYCTEDEYWGTARSPAYSTLPNLKTHKARDVQKGPKEFLKVPKTAGSLRQ